MIAVVLWSLQACNLDLSGGPALSRLKLLEIRGAPANLQSLDILSKKDVSKGRFIKLTLQDSGRLRSLLGRCAPVQKDEVNAKYLNWRIQIKGHNGKHVYVSNDLIVEQKGKFWRIDVSDEEALHELTYRIITGRQWIRGPDGQDKR